MPPPGTCTHGPLTGMQTTRPSHSVPALAVEGPKPATRGGDREHEQRALHGSLPKRKAETAPAASSRNAPPAANPAVISRSFLTLPIREPSSS